MRYNWEVIIRLVFTASQHPLEARWEATKHKLPQHRWDPSCSYRPRCSHSRDAPPPSVASVAVLPWTWTPVGECTAGRAGSVLPSDKADVPKRNGGTMSLKRHALLRSEPDILLRVLARVVTKSVCKLVFWEKVKSDLDSLKLPVLKIVVTNFSQKLFKN